MAVKLNLKKKYRVILCKKLNKSGAVKKDYNYVLGTESIDTSYEINMISIPKQYWMIIANQCQLFNFFN